MAANGRTGKVRLYFGKLSVGALLRPVPSDEYVIEMELVGGRPVAISVKPLSFKTKLEAARTKR